jgi:hypothetical protein
MTGPLLVLAAGQRCGSTLVQRLLSSHPDVLIWGEHAGQLRQFLSAGARLRVWSREDGHVAREAYRSDGHQSFMANLLPPEDVVDDAVRAFVHELFVRPAAALGRAIWGIKEVRYDRAEAAELGRLFPDTRVVHLMRDPRDVLRSLDVWERGLGEWRRRDSETAMRDWLRVGRSFLYTDGAGAPPVLRVRYEELVADPAGWQARIAAHCGLDADRLDPGVFGRRIHTDGPAGGRAREIRSWSELPESLRRLLDDDEIRMTAAAHGYDL